ncbi:hypothetical protein BB559_003638 [Furculomyces boomerangus]|uniref:Superoxide dismutase n=2 Tax=Harpellales TaxID=61421 RepID=A0A2T9YEM4_9FUNG|nr:hypothetical protein BB559_004465 [Furculomyces boomerangus]PVU92633.1 hypothetical protein BB559_003638 [Furculomyces boomerangus]PVZ98495.1 hypothetical protein BB558_005502 [Smittium angustum]
MLRTINTLKHSRNTVAKQFISSSQTRTKYTLPEIPYEYSAFSPVWSTEIVKNHHQGNHAAYVANLNATEEKMLSFIKNEQLENLSELHKLLRFNAGGHLNHTMLWQTIMPISAGGGKVVDGSLRAAIDREFDTVEKMITLMNAKTASIQGSGWGWLALNKLSGSLELITTPNQDTPNYYGYLPLFGIDAWEHAFYLDYKTNKAEYFKKIWQICNWAKVQSNFEEAMASINKV